MPSTATIDTFLVPQKTVATAKGDGPALDVSGAASRVLLLTLDITNIIEQQSLDVSIYGSVDGATCLLQLAELVELGILSLFSRQRSGC